MSRNWVRESILLGAFLCAGLGALGLSHRRKLNQV